jgi:glutathione S-transferase
MMDRTLGAAVRNLVFECRGRAPDEWDRSQIERAVQQWYQTMPQMQSALDGRAFYVDGVGIADYVLASRFGLAMAYGMPDPGSVVMQRWFQRMMERSEYQNTAPPSVTAAMQRGWQV